MKYLIFFTVCFVILFMTFCSEDRMGLPTEANEVGEISGLILYQGAEEVFEITDGYINYNMDIIIKEGELQEYDVVFMDENYSEIEIPFNPFVLCIDCDQQSRLCAEVLQNSGKWAFTLKGMEVGDVKVYVKLLNSIECSYTSPQLEVIVVE